MGTLGNVLRLVFFFFFLYFFLFFLFIYFFGCIVHGMRDLSSPTRDQTRAPWQWKHSLNH